MRYFAIRHLSSTILILTLVACSNSPTTPTLITAPPPTAVATTATPARPVCIYRTDDGVEVGVYRFAWDNVGFKLNTRIGNLNIDGPANLRTGQRTLVLAHNKRLPESFGIGITLEVNHTLLFDPLLETQEVRDVSGAILAQSINDAVGHHGGMPTYLDVARVEREFGYYPNSAIRVYLTDMQTVPQVWNYQEVGVRFGKESYRYRQFANGNIDRLYTNPQGLPSPLNGAMSQALNVITFNVQTGWEQPMQAFTATSSGEGDSVLFPAQVMKNLWEGAQRFCK